jgi:hypothetical protein
MNATRASNFVNSKYTLGWKQLNNIIAVLLPVFFTWRHQIGGWQRLTSPVQESQRARPAPPCCHPWLRRDLAPPATWPLAALCLRPRLGDMPCYGSASKSSNRDGELGTDFMDRKRDRKELARRKPLAGSVSDISIHTGTRFFFLETLPISVMTIIFIPHFLITR